MRSSDRGAFLVWGPPHRGPRSAVLARQFGITPWFVSVALPGGPWSAAPRYLAQAVLTLSRLVAARPSVVFVQTPPSVAAWLVAFYCLATRAVYVVDAHSAAFQVDLWSRPRWLHRLVSRRAAATLVTDPVWRSRVEHAGGHAIVIPNVPADYERDAGYPMPAGFNIAVVNTWAPDEPIAEIVATARQLPDVQFHITGHRERATIDLAQAPPNAHFTGFLPEPRYYALLAAADAVMCLTTRDHTMQRGACEALALGRPVITSDWPLLRGHFHRGAVHVDNTAAGIQAGIVQLMSDFPTYRAGIERLRDEDERAWHARREALVERIDSGLARRLKP